jgi:hypothetical protein
MLISRLDAAYDYGIDSNWGGDSHRRGCGCDMARQTGVAARLESKQLSTAVEETKERGGKTSNFRWYT